jgi:hypothetical protein
LARGGARGGLPHLLQQKAPPLRVGRCGRVAVKTIYVAHCWILTLEKPGPRRPKELRLNGLIIALDAFAGGDLTISTDEPRLDSAQGPLIHVKAFAERSHMIA